MCPVTQDRGSVPYRHMHMTLVISCKDIRASAGYPDKLAVQVLYQRVTAH